MSKEERDRYLSELLLQLRNVEDNPSDDPALAVKIAALKVEVQRCIKHAETLARLVDEGV